MKSAPIFKDGMILQRDRVNRVWGTVEGDESVSVTFLGKTYDAKFDGEKWYADLDAAGVGGPYEMTISSVSSGEKKIIKDILIGEVWFAGGQSNMELELQNSEKGLEVCRAANYDKIRFYNVPKYPSVDEGLDEVETQTKWRYAKGEDSREMSAVAYYFAVKLYEELQVPIGIIDCYIGGTSVTCWIPKEDTDGVEDVKPYLDDWADVIANTPPEQYEKELSAYNAELDKWNAIADEMKKENPDVGINEIEKKAGLFPWPPPRGGKSQYRPFGLYESMVSRVAPYGIRGFIYYQGEEDQDRPDSYSLLNTRLIHRWREDFSLGEFTKYPFFITQLPMFIGKDEETDPKKFTHIREQQAMVAGEDDTVGMAVISDCGEFDNIHPIDKKTPGTRLALQALGRVYSTTDKYQNMQVDTVTFDGAEVTVTFKNTYGDIHVRPSDGKQLTAQSIDEERSASEGANIYGFELSQDGRDFVPAHAVVRDQSIIVSGVGINLPTAIRYAHFDYGVANLYNAIGLPLQMFNYTSN